MGWLSLHHLVVFFLEIWSVLSFRPYFLSWCACYIVRSRAIGIGQFGAIHVTVLWWGMWGSGLKGNNMACSALCWFSVTSLTTHQQVGPFWCFFLGRWVCINYRTLWVSPMNSPLRLGVSPTAIIPTSFSSQGFLGLISMHRNLALHGLSHSSVVPPGLSKRKYGTAPAASCHFACSEPPAASFLWVLSTPAGLDECFFLNSLVVRLPYILIFWKFCLFFIFKFFVALHLVVQGGKVYLPMPPSWLEVLNAFN